MAEDISEEAAVRESAKSLFEMAMGTMVSQYREGDTEKGYKTFNVLLKVYCDSVDSNGRLLSRIKELEKGKGA